MNKDLHDIDNLFKQSIDDHLEEVPPEVWQNIDHGLDKNQAAFYKRRYFTVRAAAILLLLIGAVTIAAILRYHSSGSKEGNEQVVTNAGNDKTNGNEEAVEQVNSSKVNNDQGTALQNKTLQSTTSVKNTVERNQSTMEYSSSENSTYSAEKKEDVAAGTKKNKTNGQKEGVRVKPITSAPNYTVVDKPSRKQQEVAAGITVQFAGQGTVEKSERTRYIGARVFDVNEFQIANTLPDAHSYSTIPADLVSQTLPIADKSRSSLASWSVAPMYAQNINLNRLKDDDHFRDPRNNSREAKRTEQETKSFSVGLGVQKELSGNFSLQTGVQYFSSQTTIKPKMIFAEPDGRGDVRFRFNCSSGDSYIANKSGAPPMIGDSIRTNSAKSSLSYLQMPLLAAYRISFGKLSILPSAGIQVNFLLSSKLTSSLVQPSGDEEVSTPIDGLRSTYFSGVIQPQLNYRFSDRISFDVNPNINFSLSPINKETAVKTYQNMFGLGAGLRIRL